MGRRCRQPRASPSRSSPCSQHRQKGGQKRHDHAAVMAGGQYCTHDCFKAKLNVWSSEARRRGGGVSAPQPAARRSVRLHALGGNDYVARCLQLAQGGGLIGAKDLVEEGQALGKVGQGLLVVHGVLGTLQLEPAPLGDDAHRMAIG
eukprot:scaffold3560_cov124-Isochrysis_galbana.AAC.2